MPVANIQPLEKSSRLQRKKLDLLNALDAESIANRESDDQVNAAIANYELAFQMQSVVPDLASLDGESEATREMYGLNSKYKPTAVFGRECLLARRMIEKGVRFIELTCPQVGGDRWDQHQN